MSVLGKKIEFCKWTSDCKVIVIAVWFLREIPGGVSGVLMSLKQLNSM